jgi:23S rRNA (adenine2503-C2)-methyltransferase
MALSLPQQPDVTGLTPAQLAPLMPTAAGRPSLSRGRAVWRWLRDNGVPTAWPASLPEAGRAALHQLAQHAHLPDVKVEDTRHSRDGTIKWRLACRGMPVETVLIPNPTRSTVCVSSQSGCTRFCDFCATARMDFRGQLTAGEIVAQVLLARAHAPKGAPVTNVVFMGMGEPLDNLDAVLAAVDVLDAGLNLSPRHVTVSTSGVLPRMRELWDRSRACVALSLHATTQTQRDALMPRVARWPLTELCAFMRDAAQADPTRHFFIEYVLLAGVNDTDSDADRLVELLRGIPVRINLIPFNSSPGAPYGSPSALRVRAFQRRLVDAGMLTLTRETRGQDAAAACGQLAVLRDPPAPAPPA